LIKLFVKPFKLFKWSIRHPDKSGLFKPHEHLTLFILFFQSKNIFLQISEYILYKQESPHLYCLSDCILPENFPSTNYRLPTTDYQLPTTDYQLLCLPFGYSFSPVFRNHSGIIHLKHTWNIHKTYLYKYGHLYFRYVLRMCYVCVISKGEKNGKNRVTEE